MEKNAWLTRNKIYRIIGAALIFCALGLSVGGLVAYSHISNNLISLNNEHGITQVIDENNRIDYFQIHYILGSEESDKYSINYSSQPETVVTNRYGISGLFVNETNEHFTAVELNFSLLDKDGNKIGDAYANCNGLNSKQGWNFIATNMNVIEVNAKAVSAILDDVRITY